MRTPEQERQFLLERSQAVGGSDVQHLLNLAPYGCRRRLWYDKKGVVPDYPFTGNRHTRRGQAVEPHAIEEFCVGENYRGEGQPWVVHAERRHAGAHIDHFVWKPGADEGRGVLEVKVPSLRNYYTLCARGPTEAMLLQLQWGIAMTDSTWGVLLAFNADLWRYRFWRYDADPSMAHDLLAISDRFWESLDSDRPKWERLEPTSRQCQDCPWRKTCQGITRESPPDVEGMDEPTEAPQEDESYFDLVAAYRAAATLAADAAAAKDAAKDAILGRLGEGKPRRVTCSAGTIVYSETVIAPKAAAPQPEKRYFSLRVLPAKAQFPEKTEGDYGDIDI